MGSKGGSASGFSRSNLSSSENEVVSGIPAHLVFSNHWVEKEKLRFSKYITLKKNFITAKEELLLMQEVMPALRQVEFYPDMNHFADCGSRQTKVQFRTEANATVINRAIERGFPSTGRSIPTVHALELMELGYVQPHVSCPRCHGDIIVGINMVSSSVMRLRDIFDHEKTVDILLPARSMYKLQKSARHAFTRTILEKQHSFFNGELVERGRRVSIVLSCFLE